MTEPTVDETPTTSSPAEAGETPKVTPISLLIGVIVRPAATFRLLRDAARSYWWFALVVTVVMILALTLAESSVTASRFSAFTAGGGRTFTGAGQGNFTVTGQGNFNSTSGANGAAGNTNRNGSGSANGTGQRAFGNGGSGLGGTGAGGTGASARQFAAPSPLMTIGLPVLGGLAVTLLDYGLRAVLVFLMSMVLGGKAAFKEVFRMAAWTTIPSAIRRVVQTAAVLLSGGTVAAGFSAALSAAEIRTLPIVNLLLGYVDIYTIWSALLLGIGAAITGRLSKGKAAFAVLIYIGVSIVGILLYYAITSAIGGALGGAGGRGGAFPGAGGAGGRNVRPGG